MPHSAAEPVRLAIVNDYEIVVAGVTSMLAEYRDRVVVVDVVDRFEDLRGLDVILYDTFGQAANDRVDLSDLVGSDAKVAVFTWTLHPEAVAFYLSQGVVGFLSKGLTAGELVAALEAIKDGRVVLDPELDLGVVDGLGDWPGRELLSAREAELMAFIAKGFSNQEIADALYLSINSIKTYIRGAYRKIGVTRRAEAVIWALQNGFASETVRVTSSGPSAADERVTLILSR
jgi:NarL family two-component system response regulator LiaR